MFQEGTFCQINTFQSFFIHHASSVLSQSCHPLAGPGIYSGCMVFSVQGIANAGPTPPRTTRFERKKATKTLFLRYDLPQCHFLQPARQYAQRSGKTDFYQPGSAGIFRSPPGCAITCIFHWVAIEKGGFAPTSTSCSRCCWAGSGMARPHDLSSGVACTAVYWPSNVGGRGCSQPAPASGAAPWAAC